MFKVNTYTTLVPFTYPSTYQTIRADGMLFHDDVVQIEPCEGEVWPNSEVQCTVVLRPVEARLYTETAYCEVTGRKCRLPLKVQGQGVGPQVSYCGDTNNIYYVILHVFNYIYVYI